ncbi:hypothetical protein NM688_g3316 [Phlebia brevispora]|uniref:Uncharacterized protein n=1 Tax=Phlebia brevispora TaxID=194682 RepID=A0ACC1T678_9APHY|nr:hypothetical protein NM688_g3316 [Phlebia brevispora]
MLTSTLTICMFAFAAVATPVTPRASPQKIKLSSRKLTSGGHVRRAISPFSLPLADYFNGTDLQWFGDIAGKYLEYLMKPNLIVPSRDASSDNQRRTLCGEPCANQIQFDPSESSTFVDGGETSTIIFATGVGVDPVIGDNWELTLRTAKDTVTVGEFSIPNVSLLLITDQTAPFAPDPFSGIQGMSPMATGFFEGLVEQGLPSLFGLFLTPKSVGNAELTLGGVDTTKFTGDITFASLFEASSGAWQLRSPSISVNGKTNSALKKTRTFIFDSGTSNVVMPQADTEAIYALISPDIQPFSGEAGTYGIACSQISSLPANIGITFTSQQGAQFVLTIPSSELSVGPFRSDPTICQTLINAMEGFFIVGGSLLKHYYSAWDISNQRLGFAPNERCMMSSATSWKAANPAAQRFQRLGVPPTDLVGKVLCQIHRSKNHPVLTLHFTDNTVYQIRVDGYDPAYPGLPKLFELDAIFDDFLSDEQTPHHLTITRAHILTIKDGGFELLPGERESKFSQGHDSIALKFEGYDGWRCISAMIIQRDEVGRCIFRSFQDIYLDKLDRRSRPGRKWTGGGRDGRRNRRDISPA